MKKVKQSAEPEAPKESVTCEDCKGVGVNMAVSATVLCAACDGSGTVEV